MLATVLPVVVALTLLKHVLGNASTQNMLGSLSPQLPLNYISSCPTSIPPSCQNTTAVADTCCFEAQGLIEMVQFWDTDPATGPTNSWTIHGLWPNECNGKYLENCGESRDYPSITDVLTSNGKQDLVDYMMTYWISNDGEPETFWEHEWDTHGTCYTTINPSCLPESSTTGADAAAFFQRTVDLFKTLNTYAFLSSQGITPSSVTHSYSDLAEAVQLSYGYLPRFDCKGTTVYQITYYFNLQGSLNGGTLIPIDAPSFETSECHSTGIRYPAKS